MEMCCEIIVDTLGPSLLTGNDNHLERRLNVIVNDSSLILIDDVNMMSRTTHLLSKI